jgi:hypothetical protein
MKHNKERQISVHSSIAAASGPKPVVKIQKHFESTSKEGTEKYGSSASMPIKSLPCVCEVQEEQEALPTQEFKLNTRQLVNNRKW